MAGMHALLSPSGAHRWMECPASVYHDTGVDDSNEYSDEGTAAHALATMSLIEGVPCHGYTGRRIEVGELRTVEVTEEMAVDVQRYCDSIISYAGGMSAIGKTAFIEVEVPIGHITGEHGATGTADVVILVPGPVPELQVHDLKFGRGVEVHPEENEQLMMYALGALHAHDPLGEIQRVRMVIHQVRKGPAREWDCDVSTLRSFERRVRDAAGRAFDARSASTPPPPEAYTPGDETCRWCEHKASCAALQAHLENVVGARFEDLTKPAYSPAVLAKADDADALATRMNACDLLEDWIKAVRAEVEKRLFEGRPVPGWKIVQGKKGAREWVSNDDAEKMLRQQFRLPIEVAYNLKLKSPPQVEKLMKSGEVGPRQWEKLQEMITQREGQPSVAPESDKRPAYTLPSAADFDDVSKTEAPPPDATT
jgi:hypothetical protein